MAVPDEARAPSAVFVGAATLDALALVERFPEPDERQVAREIEFAGGGPAATAAVAFSRLGLPAAFVGAVGDDAEGEQVLRQLAHEGVDVSGVSVVAGRQTGASVVVVDAGRGTRAICTRPLPPLDIPDGSTGASLIRRAGWVHVDHLGWAAVSALLGDLATVQARPRVSVDAGNPIPQFRAAGVDLLVPTVEALARTYGDGDPDTLLDAALADGAATVVATRGGAGSVAATTAGTRASAAALPTEIVSTLGAGDVFHGALLAATVRELPLPEALRYANAVAALSCRALDGRSGIPTHDETVAALAAPVASA